MIIPRTFSSSGLRVLVLSVLLVQEGDVPLLELDLGVSEGGAGGEAGCWTPAVGQLTLLQLSDQLGGGGATLPTGGQAFVEELQGGGEVPHLDGSIVVTRQDEPPGPGAHPAAAVTLVNTETGDDGPVNRPVHNKGRLRFKTKIL